MIRVRINQKTSHPYRLMGIKLYSDIQEELDAICAMRDKRDHPILEEMEMLLSKSLGDYAELACDIHKAQTWIEDITDILLGKKDKNGERDTQKHKQESSSKQIENLLAEYVRNLIKEKEINTKKYSTFLQEIITHLYKTFINWREYLFTCYDVPILTNVNNELELSHSRLKRKHRRITGLKNSGQFLNLHGEQASFCFELDLEETEIGDLLLLLDFAKAKKRLTEERQKSKKRGQRFRGLKNIKEALKQIQDGWN